MLLCVALRIAYLAALGIAFVVSTGCGTLPNGERWGERAFELDRERIGRAARDAVLDPQTWVPALGAALFAIDDWDERVSDWAVDRTPIFGSKDAADDASDVLSFILGGEALLTALATPSGERPVWPKTKGVAVEAGAVALTAGAAGLLKSVVGRSRPLDSSSTASFPSSHAAIAFSLSALSNRNLDHLELPRGARTALRVGNTALATGVAWARVEAGKHYPSDVLAGAALGHFLTAFVHDAFLGLPDDSDLEFAILSVPIGGSATLVGFSFRY